jgi:hypothetical protein
MAQSRWRWVVARGRSARGQLALVCLQRLPAAGARSAPYLAALLVLVLVLVLQRLAQLRALVLRVLLWGSPTTGTSPSVAARAWHTLRRGPLLLALLCQSGGPLPAP